MLAPEARTRLPRLRAVCRRCAVKAVERLTNYLEAIGRSDEDGAFGFMVAEDIRSPGAAPHTSSAPVDTRLYLVRAESRED